MAIISVLNTAHSFEIRGKLGRPNELGEIWCGWSECGEYLPVAGVYQKRRSAGKQVFVRMKHYHGANPQTVPQQANRATFAQAVSAWQGLTPMQKKQWRAKKYPRYMSGYNRFIRDFMRCLIV
jgi:hypothetical protein